MTVKPTDHEIDPLLTAMLNRLTETGASWREIDCKRWCAIFESSVWLLYPPKAPRKSRAKKDVTPTGRVEQTH